MGFPPNHNTARPSTEQPHRLFAEPKCHTLGNKTPLKGLVLRSEVSSEGLRCGMLFGSGPGFVRCPCGLISLLGPLAWVVRPASANRRRVNTMQVETPSSPGAWSPSPCWWSPEAPGEGAQASPLRDERPRGGELRTSRPQGTSEALDVPLSRHASGSSQAQQNRPSEPSPISEPHNRKANKLF